MKLTKLSFVAILAVSAAFAGGDIAPVEPAVAAPVVEAAACNSNTTVSGKAQAYYFSHDSGADMFDKTTSLFGAAVTLDVAHKITSNITANFTAVGYTNLGDSEAGYFEGKETGAYLNVANITATFGSTTLVLGRQLIDSPMFGSYDWLLAPDSFEAYTIVNSAISNVTLVGTYVTKWRPNNAGDNFIDLTDINDGNHYAFGAIYGADALSASVWYYNIDAANYTQVYGDLGYNFGSVNVAGQIVATDYANATDSTSMAAKVEFKAGNIDLMAAVSNTTDAPAGYVSRDTFYTNSWNTFTPNVAIANEDTLSWKVSASTELSGLNLLASYAGYGDDGSELDVIAGYDFSKCTSISAIYTNVTANVANADALNTLEVIATYKF
jgi:hypothetical protein